MTTFKTRKESCLYKYQTFPDHRFPVCYYINFKVVQYPCYWWALDDLAI